MREVALALLLATAAAPAPSDPAAGERELELRWEVMVEVPQGARRLELWLPRPESDEHQEVLEAGVTAPVKVGVAEDPVYGNSILHLALDDPRPGTLEVAMTLRVRRAAYAPGWPARDGAGPAQEDTAGPAQEDTAGPAQDPARWLAPSPRADERTRRLAARLTRRRTGDRERARAIFDHVVRGERRRGDCAAARAFVDLARAARLPARLAAGVALPPARGAGEAAGHRCWAEVRLEGAGWVPLDLPAALARPRESARAFGALDENRVQVSVGSEVPLVPPRAAGALPELLHAYAEVDGEPWLRVRETASFEDLEPDRAEGGVPPG